MVNKRSKLEAQKRIKNLKEEIRKHRYNYHVLDKETISPEALDSLKKELFDLENIYPELVTPDSPTQRIGGEPLDKFEKVEHLVPMLSFNDAFNKEDMKNWLKRVNNYLGYNVNDRSGDGFYCELKFDGLAVELVYENGLFVQGSTRGDGKVGEDVTQNLKTIDSIPLSIDIEQLTVVRGEVLITKDNFQKVNNKRKKDGEPVYANPRNLAAGTIRQLDPSVVKDRDLDFFAYDIALGFDLDTHEEEHEVLKKLGFREDDHSKTLKTLNEVFSFRDEWVQKRDRLDYEIDGIVVQINNNEIYDEAGVVGKAPRAAMAYKFPAKEATTIIKDIKIQIGRTGALTPVAVLEPVEVGGITISHASLHNEDQIKRLGVRKGDTVIVSRAGDVIPQVIRVLKDLRTGEEKVFKMPSVCPVDGSKIKKDGAILRCSNPRCGARNKEQLYHFVSKKGFNIDGVGPKIIDRFLDEGIIADFSDLFDLRQGDIEALEGFQEKSADNIVKELDKKKSTELPKFIYSLGILHIGEENSTLLANVFSKIGKITKPSDVIKVIKRFSLKDLQDIDDIGPEIAKSIYDWARDDHNKTLMKNLDNVGIKIKEYKIPSKKSSSLSGKTFVLTGTMESMSRDESKQKIRNLGGKVTNSVTRSTDYVVVGKTPGSKYDKAKELGIILLDEKKFLKLLKS